MKPPEGLGATLALIQAAAQFPRAARRDIGERPSLGGHHLPNCERYSGANRRTTSANSISDSAETGLGLNIFGPPSVEEAVRDVPQQFSQILTQRFRQVRVVLRGLQTRMPQQDLNQANIHAPLEHERGETVPERMRTKPLIEATGGPGFLERHRERCLRADA